MAYDRDLRALRRIERCRQLTVLGALASLVTSSLLEIAWLDWARAVLWASAGGIAMLESPMRGRVGRSQDSAYLWAILAFLVAALCLI